MNYKIFLRFRYPEYRIFLDDTIQFCKTGRGQFCICRAGKKADSLHRDVKNIAKSGKALCGKIKVKKRATGMVSEQIKAMGSEMPKRFILKN